MRILIASMLNGRPRERPAHTVAAWLTISIESAGRANQPRIVQRLHDRHAGRRTGVIRRRRYERKSIVEMSDVRLFSLQQLPKITTAVPGPDRTQRKSRYLKQTVPVNFIIVTGVFHYLVAGGDQQLLFAFEDFVFTAAK